MLNKISANKTSFKEVLFYPGFNVILADRSENSSKKDSRNGLGKSTLIEIIHFIFGGSIKKNVGLGNELLSDWEFSAEVKFNNSKGIITRSLRYPSTVIIAGNIEIGDRKELPLIDEDGFQIDIESYKNAMEHLFFGVSSFENKGKYSPSFRSLFSYFVRRQPGSYISPFEFMSKQPQWSVQVHNAYLLNLNWKLAIENQELKDKKQEISSIKKALKETSLKNFFSTIGELEYHRTRLVDELFELRRDIDNFNVYPQYHQLESRVNNLTKEINKLSNRVNINDQIIKLYKKSQEEEEGLFDDISSIYEEVGIILPNIVVKRIDEVREFHDGITSNRKEFLIDEIKRILEENTSLLYEISEMDQERAENLKVLDSHGAFSELHILQQREIELSNKYNEIIKSIDYLYKIDELSSNQKISQENWFRKARRDYEERVKIREKAISLFNSFSEKLYNAPGKLIIDVDNNGYKFDIEIERSSSQGIGNMKVFCYDLMLACLWSEKSVSPSILVHDSIIFDGVDERQIAIALELACEMAGKYGFQYICAMNSDTVPYHEFSNDFNFNQYIRLKLSDKDISGSLLGIKF